MRIRAHQHSPHRIDLPQTRPAAFNIPILGTRADHHHVDAHADFRRGQGGCAAPRRAATKQREAAGPYQFVSAAAHTVAFQHRFSELDFDIYPTARKLGLKSREARMVMTCTKRWKLVHFGPAFPPQLFDLHEDPLELHDRGRDPGTPYAAARDELYHLMFDWMRARRNRIAMTDETVNRRPSPSAAGGVKIGIW